VIYTVVFSPHGKLLASSDNLGTVILWDVPASKRWVIHESNQLSCAISLAFTSDETTLAAGTTDSVVHLWNVKTREEVATFRPDVGSVRALAFSPDGTILAHGGGKEILSHDRPTQYLKCDVKLWDVSTEKEIASWPGHTRSLTCLSFSPDGKMLASGSKDGTVRLWEVASGKLRRALVAPGGFANCVIFSPDGELLAAGGEGSEGSPEVRVWKVATGAEVTTLQGKRYPVEALAFSTERNVIVAAISDGTVSRYRLPDPDQ
jgi:WD40 repeat protein